VKRTAGGFGLCLAVSTFIAVIGASILNAQEVLTASPVKRALILKTELEGVEGKEMHAWGTEFAPGASSGKHYHPWNEFVYVLEGAFTIEVQGNPAVTLKPGEIISLAPKQVHEGKNLLNSPTKVLVFGLAPRGESLVVPVN
jgi:quercetin dioxygenase-like cupin family protein